MIVGDGFGVDSRNRRSRGTEGRRGPPSSTLGPPGARAHSRCRRAHEHARARALGCAPAHMRTRTRTCARACARTHTGGLPGRGERRPCRRPRSVAQHPQASAPAPRTPDQPSAKRFVRALVGAMKDGMHRCCLACVQSDSGFTCPHVVIDPTDLHRSGFSRLRETHPSQMLHTGPPRFIRDSSNLGDSSNLVHRISEIHRISDESLPPSLPPRFSTDPPRFIEFHQRDRALTQCVACAQAHCIIYRLRQGVWLLICQTALRQGRSVSFQPLGEL